MYVSVQLTGKLVRAGVFGRDYLRGDMRPSVHVRAHTIRGRLLCRLGPDRRQEAAASFETAANSANEVRVHLVLCRNAEIISYR